MADAIREPKHNQHARDIDTASPNGGHDSGKMLEEAAKNALENVKRTFGDAVIGLQNTKWEELPKNVKDYIYNNPRMTAFQVLSLLFCQIPGLIVTPMLGILGFGGLGPVAGTAAAGFQSSFGTPLVFRACQSAAMGGWGAVAVNGIVSGGAAAAGVVGTWVGRKKSEGG